MIRSVHESTSRLRLLIYFSILLSNDCRPSLGEKVGILSVNNNRLDLNYSLHGDAIRAKTEI